ncbi:MAG TPA: TonB-dependent receptor plug domain-containing protein, partial [Opitutaceae bacterium]|nr:TonB-dependent receptor plug domain-containing protein [Opitutaceae bacterium]
MRLHQPCSAHASQGPVWGPLLFCLFLLTATISSLTAQSEGRGNIEGRIFNPATSEYLRNASITVRETGESVVAEDGGVYRISGVRAGTVTLDVNYTGFRTATASVTVTTGTTTTQNFDLISSLQSSATTDDGTVKLEQFVVSSGAREGNAKAIMDQRRSMNITNSVASDSFGDVAEGNVGEFLKHMPGVMLNLVEGEARTVSLRGLGPEYTSVTLDGVALSSADANSGAAGNARAFSFEQVSLNSMESIEVSKTISADVDANAPAGTINLKPKRAFDREGRRISMQANVTAFGRELTFDRTPGPDDNRSRKIRGGGIFEYSDVFLDKRLGVVLNISESNVYSEITHTTVTWNETTDATDTRIAVPTQINSFHGPRTNRRSTVTLTTDFKATDNLILSGTFIHNESDLWFFYRNQIFNTGGTRSSVVGQDPLVSITSGNTGSVTVNPIAVAKQGTGNTFVPKFEYKKGDLIVEGRFAISDSESTYEPQKRGAFRTAGSPTANGVTFTAERSSVLTADWKIKQTAGPDISNGANFTSPTIETQDGRYNRVKVYSGDVTASLRTRIAGLPVTWKTGVKKSRNIVDFDITREAFRYDYIGPGAGLGAWANYRSPFDYDLSALNSSVSSSSGGKIFYPDLLAMTSLFFKNPELFRQSLTGANYYNAYVANRKHYEEDIDAAFLMATTTKGKFTARAGMRWEQTTGDS